LGFRETCRFWAENARPGPRRSTGSSATRPVPTAQLQHATESDPAAAGQKKQCDSLLDRLDAPDHSLRFAIPAIVLLVASWPAVPALIRRLDVFASEPRA
jgi:hypothetical protein